MKKLNDRYMEVVRDAGMSMKDTYKYLVSHESYRFMYGFTYSLKPVHDMDQLAKVSL